MIASHERIIHACGNGSGWRVQLRFILFRELQLNGGEVYAVFEGFLLRLHAFNIAADADYPFLHLEDVHNVSGALLKHSAEALFGIAGVGCLSPAARTSPFCASRRAAAPIRQTNAEQRSELRRKAVSARWSKERKSKSAANVNSDRARAIAN